MHRTWTRILLALGLLALAVAAGLWLSGDPQPESHSAAPTPPGPEAAGESPSPGEAAAGRLPEPTHHFSGGRLWLDLELLPPGETLVLALDLPDEARGETPREAVIACTNGRRQVASAPHRPGKGAGVQFELDSGWLEPGRCLISVPTAEHRPLAVRRYVIEIR